MLETRNFRRPNFELDSIAEQVSWNTKIIRHERESAL